MLGSSLLPFYYTNTGSKKSTAIWKASQERKNKKKINFLFSEAIQKRCLSTIIPILDQPQDTGSRNSSWQVSTPVTEQCGNTNQDDCSVKTEREKSACKATLSPFRHSAVFKSLVMGTHTSTAQRLTACQVRKGII